MMNQELQSGRDTPILVDPEWLLANMHEPGVRIVDCRPSEQYQLAHIPEAAGLPIDYFLKEPDERGVARGGHIMSAPEFETLMGALGVTNKSMVVSYDDNGGRGATRMWWVLNYFGHHRSAVLDGGWRRWTSENRRATTEIVLPAQQHFVARPEGSLIADLQDVRTAVSEGHVQIIDCRSVAEYDGTDFHGNKRSGHIPGARRLEWNEAILPEGDSSFRPLFEIQRCVDVLNLDKIRPVITYCQSGIRASHVAFSLALLGFKHVRVYDASMAEWANREDTLLEA